MWPKPRPPSYTDPAGRVNRPSPLTWGQGAHHRDHVLLFQWENGPLPHPRRVSVFICNSDKPCDQCPTRTSPLASAFQGIALYLVQVKLVGWCPAWGASPQVLKCPQKARYPSPVTQYPLGDSPPYPPNGGKDWNREHFEESVFKELPEVVGRPLASVSVLSDPTPAQAGPGPTVLFISQGS